MQISIQVIKLEAKNNKWLDAENYFEYFELQKLFMLIFLKLQSCFMTLKFRSLIGGAINNQTKLLKQR